MHAVRSTGLPTRGLVILRCSHRMRGASFCRCFCAPLEPSVRPSRSSVVLTDSWRCVVAAPPPQWPAPTPSLTGCAMVVCIGAAQARESPAAACRFLSRFPSLTSLGTASLCVIQRETREMGAWSAGIPSGWLRRRALWTYGAAEEAAATAIQSDLSRREGGGRDG